MLKIVCGIFVLVGTYILSKGVFEGAVKRQVNLNFKELPWYVKAAIILFGYRHAYINKALWEEKAYPSLSDFSIQQRVEAVGPFVGFLLISVGTITLLFL